MPGGGSPHRWRPRIAPGVLFGLSGAVVTAVIVRGVLSGQYRTAPPYVIWGFIGIMTLSLLWVLALVIRSDARRRAEGVGWLFLIMTGVTGVATGYANLFLIYGVQDDLDCGRVVARGVSCLYLSVMTLTTVGYGDVTPKLGFARLAAAIEGPTGFLILGLLVAAVPRLLVRVP